MSTEELIQTYYFMRLTRAIEDRTRTLFLQGRLVDRGTRPHPWEQQ